MSVPFLSGVDVVRNTDSTGSGSGAHQSQGGAAAARRVHTPEVGGSNPPLATIAALADGVSSLQSAVVPFTPARLSPGLFI